jgi:hypothetical protein
MAAGGALLNAPCGHRGACFHETCLIEWSALHARCPHCNAPDTNGTVLRLVRWWMVQEEEAGDDDDDRGGAEAEAEAEEGLWRRGPLFVALAPREAEEEAERSASRALLRTLLGAVEGARVTRRSLRTLGVVAVRRGPDRHVEVTLRRTAWLARGGQRLRDGFMLSAVRRRVSIAGESGAASGEGHSAVPPVLTDGARGG